MQPGPFTRFFFLLFLFSLAHGFAQSFLCYPTATNLINHAEGLAEPSGDISLNCSGGTPGTAINTNILLSYNVPVTNRLNGSGFPDALMTINTTNLASGAVPVGVTPLLQSANTLAFNGVTFTVPASGAVTIHITNVRVNANVAGAGRPVIVNLSTTSLSTTSSSLTVATPTTGLLATYANSGITCVGSPLPATINLPNLFATGTNFASTRLTEGFGAAFIPKDPTSDSGTRILLTYSNFPAGASVYIPDFVAGNDAVIPTAAGDLGGTQSGGVYSPSASGTLLLARVSGADATGLGGSPIVTAASLAPNTALNTVTQVPMVNGAGTATYEVIDANAIFQENAQFPTFIGLPVGQNQTTIATESLSLAPVNTTPTSAAGLPIPRFSAASPPPNDCSIVGDCGANYFPILSATTTGLQFSVSPTGNVLNQTILVNNTGGGNLVFTPAISYQGTASNWLTVFNESGGTNHTTLLVTANPAGLAQGTYQAIITVNGGSAGTQTFTATFSVGAPQIIVSSVLNAATLQPGALVAGSLATIKGTNFSGTTVTVTFNGTPGNILYNGAQQINVQVPASLASLTSAQIVVTVNGNSSAATTVQLVAINPGIFGVLNQDNSVNSATNPAASGTIIQIFATGLLGPVSTGPVIVGLGTQGMATLYSGAAPNGVQQVNAQLPANAASIPGVLVVCGTNTNAQRVCSPAFTIYLK